MGGGGGGGGNKNSRNNMSLTDRGVGNIPYWDSNDAQLPSFFSPGTPYAGGTGVTPGSPGSVAGQAAGAYGGALQGQGLMGMFGADMLSSNMPGGDLSPYMNPFTDQVIDRSIGDMQRERAWLGNSIEDEMLGMGSAYGGSRHGIREALADESYLKNVGDLSARLRSDSFNNAQDQQRYFSGLGGSLLGEGAGGAANLANLGFGFARDINQDQLLSGALQQQQMQSVIDAIKGQYGGYTGAPDKRFNMQSVLPNIGNAGTSTTTQSMPGYNPMGDIMGMMGMLMMSDRRLKENIRPIGKTDNGIPIYIFNYIEDKNKAPHIGVIAQEVAEIIPDAVIEMESGYLAVDYSKVI